MRSVAAVGQCRCKPCTPKAKSQAGVQDVDEQGKQSFHDMMASNNVPGLVVVLFMLCISRLCLLGNTSAVCCHHSQHSRVCGIVSTDVGPALLPLCRAAKGVATRQLQTGCPGVGASVGVAAHHLQPTAPGGHAGHSRHPQEGWGGWAREQALLKRCDADACR